MGIFSAIGGAVGSMLTPFIGPLGPVIGSALGGAIDGKESHQRYSGGETQKQESRINFQQMADDARAAGFNPLTALRTTGGMGNVVTRYSTPLIDHGKFGISEALAGAYQGYSSFKAMEQQKQQFGLERQLIKSQIAMNENSLVDVYSEYGNTIPVQVGNKITQLNTQVAKRSHILPGSPLTAQELQDILGEVVSETIMVTDSSIAESVLDDGMNANSNANPNVSPYYDFLMNLAGNIKQPFGMVYQYLNNNNSFSIVQSELTSNEVLPFINNTKKDKLSDILKPSILGLTGRIKDNQDFLNNYK